MIPSTLKFPLIFYLLAIIGNFGCSTLLHIINWSDEITPHLRRLDHIMIFIKILATYCASISTVIPDINLLVKYVITVGTILGLFSRIYFTEAPKLIIAIPYFIVGWAILLDPYAISLIIQRIPVGALIALLGGIMYSIGGYIYSKQYRLPCHRYIGYHELFHIFSIVGTSLFAFCVFNYMIPYYNMINTPIILQ
jgi:hemolysin III